MTRCATRWLIVLVFLVTAALAHADGIISNANFQQGLTGWQAFTTSNGTLGAGEPQVVAFSPDGGLHTYDAAQFQVGQETATNAADQEGGGIFQNIMLPGGPVQFSVSIAAQGGTSANLYGGFAQLLIDSQPVAGYDFGQLQQGQIKTQTVSFSDIEAAGNHSIGIEFLRPATADNTTPFQYTYGWQSDIETPEPDTYVLLGGALALLLLHRALRSRRRAGAFPQQ